MRLVLVVLALLTAAPVHAADQEKIEKLTFGSGGRTRVYYLFVPEKARAGSAPLLILLHGSGRDGKSLVDPWRSLASKEGIILVAPDASDRAGWRVPEDGPDFLYDLAELVRVQYDADPRRIYIFGHSAGAGMGLDMAVLESQYFAAVAVHAGVLDPVFYQYAEAAPRKTPIGIWIGTDDRLFPLKAVRATRDGLASRGFELKYTEIARHTHDYYGTSARTNAEVWAFLASQHLAAEPRFQRYQIQR
jgi:poly(3-hydroxybutyrate) depolymerase